MHDAITISAVIGVLLVLLNVAIRVVALGVIPANRRPSTGMAWLLLVLLSPIVGVIAFAFFGSPRLERKRHTRLRGVNEAIAKRTRASTFAAPAPDQPAYLPGVVELNWRLGSLPLTTGNAVELIPGYADSIRAMTEAVCGAREYVLVEFYITALDPLTEPLFDALDEAAARGVEVRLLYDHLGSRGIPGYDKLVGRLEAGRLDWHPMMPLQPLKGRYRRPDLRNHRKLLVVDGLVAFAGSQNLTEPGYNKPKNHKLGREWVELMVRLHGQVVTAYEAVFASDWLLETHEVLDVHPHDDHLEPPAGALRDVACQVVPSGPGYVYENNLRLFTSLLYSATQRISLTSPYFVPDESLLYAVTTAVQRGVDVELFVSELSDQFMVGHAQASYYQALLEAGIRIYRYPAPFILHSKHFTIDDTVAVIGSSNMDMRSFALNYEVSLMMLGPEAVSAMRVVEDAYREKSSELHLEVWRKRSGGQRYVDNVMRLTAALQ